METMTQDQQALNAALAAKAAEGDKQALAQLWEQNKGLVYFLTGRWYRANAALAAAHGLTSEDLEQEGYIALVFAAKSYAAEKGLFSSWLSLAIKRQLVLALTGAHRRSVVGADGVRRTVSADPLNACASLDTPISEDEGAATLGDLQEDPAGRAALEAVEESLFREELRAAIEEALSKLPEKEAEAVRLRYYQRQAVADVGKALECSGSRSAATMRRALHKLRLNPALKKWHDEVIGTHALQGVGLHAWQHGGAVEERTVEYLEARGAYIKEALQEAP